MQENELHKLGKTELLTIIYEQEKQLEQLKDEIKELNQKLENRTITIKEAGSIADASLKINKIFDLPWMYRSIEIIEKGHFLKCPLTVRQACC